MNGPTPEQIEEALKWADQPLDRVIERDLPALKAFHVLAAALRSSQAKLGAAHACDYFSEPNHTPSSRLCADCGKVVDAFRSEINEAEKERDSLAEKLLEMDRRWKEASADAVKYLGERDDLAEKLREAERREKALDGVVAHWVERVDVLESMVVEIRIQRDALAGRLALAEKVIKASEACDNIDCPHEAEQRCKCGDAQVDLITAYEKALEEYRKS